MGNEHEPHHQPVVDAAPADSSLPAPTSDDKMWAMFVHLSALISLAIGGMTWIGPLVIWLIKKDQSKFVDWHGREALNFLLIKWIALLLCIVGSFATCGIGAFIFIPVAIAIYVYSIVIWIIAAMQANKGDYYRYPFVPRLLN